MSTAIRPPWPKVPEVIPPPALYDGIRDSVARTHVGGPPFTQRRAIALAVIPVMALAVLWIAATVVYGRPFLRVDLALHLLPALVGVVGLTLASTFVAVRRGARGLGTTAATLVITAALVAPSYAAMSLWASQRPADVPGSPIALSPSGLPCISIAAALGTMVLVALTMALRRSVPVTTRLRGAVLGAAAGAWAGLTVFVFCPAGEVPHILIGHVLPVLAFTIAGALALPRVLRI